MLVSIEVLQALAQQFNTPNKESSELEVLVSDILEAQQNLLGSTDVTLPVKKKRGRPSKADIAAREAAEAIAKAINKEQEFQAEVAEDVDTPQQPSIEESMLEETEVTTTDEVEEAKVHEVIGTKFTHTL